jgi:hypothetical protein
MPRLFGLISCGLLFVSSSKICPGISPPLTSNYCQSDPLLPTRIFHWTFNVSALNDTTNYLYDKANSAAALNAQWCAPYLEYLNTSDPRRKQEIIENLQVMSKGDIAGFGAYFAEDPFTSLNYGNILVELEVPPSTKCLKYSFRNNEDVFHDPFIYFKVLPRYLLSDAEILVYPWATPALVVRDFSSLMPLKFKAMQLKVPKVLEIYKLPPIFNQGIVFDDWKRLYLYYGSWISSSAEVVNLFSEDSKFLQSLGKEQITKLAITEAINFEFSSITPDIAAAKTQRNLSYVYFSIYPDSLNSSHLNLKSNLDGKLLNEFLICANYLPESAISVNLTDTPQLLIEHFTSKNGTYNLMKMAEAFISIRDQTPRISTWKYISTATQ